MQFPCPRSDALRERRSRAFTLIEPFDAAQGSLPAVRKRKCGAFTLIELLVVVSIIAVLASMSIPAATMITTKARESKAMSTERQIAAQERERFGSEVAPIIDEAQFDLSLKSTDHRMGLEVYTRFHLHGQGRVIFRSPRTTPNAPAVLMSSSIVWVKASRVEATLARRVSVSAPTELAVAGLNADLRRLIPFLAAAILSSVNARGLR